MNAPLVEVQRDLHDYLLDVGDAVLPRIRSGGRINVAQRLGIYHNAYRVRLADTLRDTYEKTWSYLGDTRFDACARAYIDAHPPRHRSLRDYGAQFPDWLDAQFPADRDIAELARMDWLLRQAFDGPDAAALGIESLAPLAAEQWETLILHPLPTLALLPLQFNTPAIWTALERGETPPVAQRLDDAAGLCIWRREWQPHFRTIEAQEFAALQALRQGMRFADVCQSLAAGCDDAQGRLAQYLHTWFADGLIAGVAV
ncbi:MAG: hypothetical protein B7Y26_11780 [Hydrogenophilales bacterium 16-64-46]|nr:MAG: hypothetical protein B7Z32_10855 [Hydrogenophilales bacterium 12-64-13]OYZ04402.1 MAG: hypothetical protein B7Y26_11780 [Hydrogenophilales bacterium 16-64-46]OZA38234.1 MAG: hypothetical protein B7X87_06970 [Hydrogenophilales bacterium 17-64-34]HQS99137.1 DNA-binding domain-containing protein [Thiobacillus sp.]